MMRTACRGGLLAVAALCLALPAQAREWPLSAMASAYAHGAAARWVPRGGTEKRPPQRTAGTASSLEIRQARARIPQHDVDLGRTEIVVRARPGGRLLCRETFSELWECLGFDAGTRKYVLASINEHGVKVTLRGLLYFDERTAAFRDSAFAATGFEAVASLLSPGKRRLALIGTTASDDVARLYVLDLVTDRLSRLGAAPAPPPLTAEEWRDPDMVELLGAWEAPGRHYLELEPGIWSFAGDDLLQVSYGRDTLRARAARRSLKRYDLRS